uniref:Pyrophosphate--fructose 6-phosphate 1-phosphotransferase subunit alpha 2 n=1 Tax=Zea mays TaxID=4577 RepID=A0A804PX79_MAIZE
MKEDTYKGKKFNAICHFLGYQARGALPSKFDCDYAYATLAVCSLQSLGAVSPAKSELVEIVPQEKSPKGYASFFRASSFLPFLPRSFFNGCGSVCTCSIVILLFHSFHSTNATESKVFYLKMKGDYHSQVHRGRMLRGAP